MTTTARLLAAVSMTLAIAPAQAWMYKLVHEDGRIEYVKTLPYDLYDPNRPRWPHIIIINDDAEPGPIVPQTAAAAPSAAPSSRPVVTGSARSGARYRVLYRMTDETMPQ